MKRLLTLILTLFLVASLSACGNQTTASQTGATKPNTIRIGYQKYGTMSILKAQGSLEKSLSSKRIAVQWTEFPGGPQLLEAMNAGSIDIGHTGEAPPIFAQAAGTPLVYLGHGVASPESEAILVQNDSPIKSVKDLKGKKVALNKGSNVHYLLVKLLEAEGLKYTDIETVFLSPADARAAFERGSVSAWVIWDPYFAAAETATKARILANGKNTVSNHEFYLASKSFAAGNQDIINFLMEELQKADEWGSNNHRANAEMLSPQLGIDVESLQRASGRRQYGVEMMDQEVIDEQQQIADTFLQIGLIPKKIHIKDAIINQK